MTTEEKAKRYWRVPDQFGNHTIIQADGFAISERGDLAFHSDTSASWQRPHTVNKHFWRAVTECDQEGKPLWSRDVPGKTVNIEADFTGADIEVLKKLIESMTDSAIRKAVED
jgi:hypothetical protein